MREEWRDIEGYKGLYQVSNKGRVKSLERTVWNGKGYYKAPERILKAGKARGYLRVRLYKDNKAKWECVHRLVATAFIPNPNSLPFVNHKNEVKSDNYVQNLEWCNASYNNSYNDKAKKAGKKLRNDQRISKSVIGINKVSGLIMEFPSLMEASRQMGIDNGHICACCKGRYKSAGGYYWHYANSEEVCDE